MEVRYPIKVLYTLGSSQLMLARADAVECRAVKPRPNAKAEEKHASTTIKECLSALCTASPELLADPRADHSVYALDPLQSPELMVGRGLLTWLMAESGRVVGTVKEDYVDGEEMDVLEIRLSLTPTVAVSRAQHATSLQNISHPGTSTANPSPPSTPAAHIIAHLSQPQSHSTRTSTRLRIKTTARAKKEASATPPPPKKRGRPKKPSAPAIPLPQPAAQGLPIIGPLPPGSPSTSRSAPHSRVSSVSSLAAPSTRPPASFSSASTYSRAPAQPDPAAAPAPEAPQSTSSSPNQSLARFLLAASAASANSASSSSVTPGTPLLDSLLARLKAAGLLPPGAAGLVDAEGSIKQEGASDAQRQALLTILKLAASSPGRKGRTSPGLRNGDKGKARAIDVEDDEPGVVQGPHTVPAATNSTLSAPSPAFTTAPSPSLSAPPLATLGVRKRDPEEDDEIVEIDPRVKRSRVGLGDGRSASLSSLEQSGGFKAGLGDGRSISVVQLQFGTGRNGLDLPRCGTAGTNGVSPAPSMLTAPSPSFSATSPNFSAASPSVSVTSPNDSALSPHLSTISPSLSAASPYPYSASAPPAMAYPPTSAPTPPTWLGSQSDTPIESQPPSQPNASTSSQPNPPTNPPLSQTSSQSQSQPTKPKKRAPRQTPLQAQTDLPLWSGPFVTPREQIGLPRIPAEVDSSSGPARGRTPGGGVKKGKEKDKKERGVSEEEVRVMLASGYYPSGGLEDGHRRLFGAASAGPMEEGAEKGAENTREAGPGDVPRSTTKVEKVVETAPVPAPTPLPPPQPTTASSYNPAGASSYYRSSQPVKPAPPCYGPISTTTAPSHPPAARQPQPPARTQRRAPVIPKHSPVALPAVSRLPMMMTSPIRPTGARNPEPKETRKGKGGKTKAVQEPPAPAKKERQFPLSLNEYSPLKRLLKTAGVDNLGEVLGRGGVLALKGDGGWAGNENRAGAKAMMIREQEREVVDLTSDAEEDDAPVEPVKALALAGKPRAVDKKPEPRTPPQRTVALPAAPPTPRRSHVQPEYATPHRSGSIEKPSSSIRRANTSPQRAADSPLFTLTPNPDSYPEPPSSEGPTVPLDLPPSSPPPMSDSDLEAGSEKKGAYRESIAPYTDGESSDAPLDLGLSLDGAEGGSDEERELDSYADFDDTDGDGWNETIRPIDSAQVESEGPVVGSEGSEFGSDGLVLGEQSGLEEAENVEFDLASLTNLLDMLNAETSTENVLSAELEAMLAQGTDSTGVAGVAVPEGQEAVGLDAAAFDFSWLDALGSGVSDADFGIPGIASDEDNAEGEGDLAQILAALGTA
ncbi:hypothetical protein BDV93DRAFT_607953 [Ceratobasidium sp. AG-I]|nr:hypothetical protein BDV93DRAFT_607953 [Ceratobasidium sp. AG-I]